MADKEVPDLTAADDLDGVDVFHVVKSGDSRKATISQFLPYFTTVSVEFADQVAVTGGLPELVLQDRGGNAQANMTMQFNPDWGSGTQFSHVGFAYQEWDETADPEALTGQKTGIGWRGKAAVGFNSHQPYFVDSDGVTSYLNITGEYTVASAPDAGDYEPGTTIYVSNGDTGSPCLAVSNGTNWKVVAAVGATISAS